MSSKYLDRLTKSVTMMNYALAIGFVVVLAISYFSLQEVTIENFFIKLASEEYVEDFALYNAFAAIVFFSILIKAYLPLVAIVFLLNLIGRAISRELQSSFLSFVASIVFYVLTGILILRIEELTKFLI